MILCPKVEYCCIPGTFAATNDILLSECSELYSKITYRVLRIFCEQLFSMLDKLILCALRGYCSTSPQTGSCSAKPELKMLK